MQLFLQVLNAERTGAAGQAMAEVATGAGLNASGVFADILSTDPAGVSLETPAAPVIEVVNPDPGYPQPSAKNVESISIFSGRSDVGLVPDIVSTPVSADGPATQHANGELVIADFFDSRQLQAQTSATSSGGDARVTRRAVSHAVFGQDQPPTRLSHVSQTALPGDEIKTGHEARTEVILPMKPVAAGIVDPKTTLDSPAAPARVPGIPEVEGPGLWQGRTDGSAEVETRVGETATEPVAKRGNQPITVVVDAASSAPRSEAEVFLPSAGSGVVRTSGDILTMPDRPVGKAPPPEMILRNVPDTKGDLIRQANHAGSMPPGAKTSAPPLVLAAEEPSPKAEGTAPFPDFLPDRIRPVQAQTQVGRVEPPAIMVQDPAVAAKADLAQSEDLRTRNIAAPSPEILTVAGALEGADARRSPEPGSPRLPDPAARPVIAQIVQAAQSASEGIVEVRLSPEELGRVRLSMAAGENGMTVQVMAERPETLDLLRRHIDMLAADLREQGFGDIDFSFGQDHGYSRANDDSPGNEDDGDQVADRAAADGCVKARPTIDGRLDIRL